MANLNNFRIPAVIVAGAIALAVPAVKHDEGRSLVTYRDIAGIATYCDGETEGAVMGKTYTHEYCDQLTQARVAEFAQAVADRLTVPVTKYQLAAFTGFAYNVGIGAFSTSTALRETNAGNKAAGCQAMDKFVCITVAKGKGDTQGPCKKADRSKKFVQGLLNRRNREIAMCMREDDPAEIVQDHVAGASGTTRPWWKLWG